MSTIWLPFRDDVTEVTGHRNPTKFEYTIGEGAIHYKTFPVELWMYPTGKPKKWIKCPQDKLRYYR